MAKVSFRKPPSSSGNPGICNKRGHGEVGMMPNEEQESQVSCGAHTHNNTNKKKKANKNLKYRHKKYLANFSLSFALSLLLLPLKEKECNKKKEISDEREPNLKSWCEHSSVNALKS